ncbi:hypothetical protein CYLTODRAFT_424079 [Cylindrobasidium torrendii FP15055 ss-10]|uniref:Uncharacterized protein n=1 Tax=Cylindrobasidium torrendii FP15055 ss-10 TaxID=1314674 RepID=A0A0D7B5E9_9AGAR|nr:hypothetical protein CYLTODRAFT_424079 [Cylindrobasidium torrendii FP15055 ss-10]
METRRAHLRQSIFALTRLAEALRSADFYNPGIPAEANAWDEENYAIGGILDDFALLSARESASTEMAVAVGPLLYDELSIFVYSNSTTDACEECHSSTSNGPDDDAQILDILCSPRPPTQSFDNYILELARILRKAALWRSLDAFRDPLKDHFHLYWISNCLPRISRHINALWSIYFAGPTPFSSWRPTEADRLPTSPTYISIPPGHHIVAAVLTHAGIPSTPDGKFTLHASNAHDWLRALENFMRVLHTTSAAQPEVFVAFSMAFNAFLSEVLPKAFWDIPSLQAHLRTLRLRPTTTDTSSPPAGPNESATCLNALRSISAWTRAALNIIYSRYLSIPDLVVDVHVYGGPKAAGGLDGANVESIINGWPWTDRMKGLAKQCYPTMPPEYNITRPCATAGLLCSLSQDLDELPFEVCHHLASAFLQV